MRISAHRVTFEDIRLVPESLLLLELDRIERGDISVPKMEELTEQEQDDSDKPSPLQKEGHSDQPKSAPLDRGNLG